MAAIEQDDERQAFRLQPEPNARAALRPLRAAVIFNPTAGWARGGWRRDSFRRYLDALMIAGVSVSLRETRCAGDATRLARAAAEEAASPGALDMVIAAGGDGTINETVNGLVASGSAANGPAANGPAGNGVAGTDAAAEASLPGRRPPPLPIGILPLGTANVLAHEIGLPFEPRALAETLARVHAPGATRPLHLGLANGRRFVLMAGVGLDAHVVERVDLKLKRRLGKAAYALATVGTAPGFAWPRYRLEILEPAGDHTALAGESAEALGEAAGSGGATMTAGGAPSLEGSQIIAAKARFYGGRNLLAPLAAPWRPDFQVCLFTRSGLWPATVYGARLFSGRIAGAAGFRILPARRLRIDGPEGEPVQADGDIIARLPVEIALHRDAVRIITPCG